MTKTLNIKFEKAVRLLSDYMPVSDESSRKPVLFHDLRVGVWLYEKDYSEDVVLAGLLHDILEFSDISPQVLEDEFGGNVLRLVQASTKNLTIADKDEQTDELIKRCAQNGQEALVVKMADVIDSFKFYFKLDDKNQLSYCMRNTSAILKYKPDNFSDKVFNELKEWQSRISNLSAPELK